MDRDKPTVVPKDAWYASPATEPGGPVTTTDCAEEDLRPGTGEDSGKTEKKTVQEGQLARRKLLQDKLRSPGGSTARGEGGSKNK